MSFPLTGNGRIKQAVMSFVSEKRIPHAIIIEGDIGTGRHTLAGFIASTAVCPEAGAPCGKCKSCLLYASKNHPDISVTAPEDGKKGISVSQIRALRGEAFVKPHMSAVRAFIIDSADTLNEQSQNALLKILEEPPETVMFILITESKSALLETIISRCVVLSLNPPERAEALDFLSNTTNFQKSEIEAALEASRNNIGSALRIMSGESESKTAVAASEFLDKMRENDLWGMLSAASAAEKSRIDADRFFKDLKYYTAQRLKAEPSGCNAKAYSLLYSQLCDLEKSLATNINLSLLCTLLVCGAVEDIKA